MFCHFDPMSIMPFCPRVLITVSELPFVFCTTSFWRSHCAVQHHQCLNFPSCSVLQVPEDHIVLYSITSAWTSLRVLYYKFLKITLCCTASPVPELPFVFCITSSWRSHCAVQHHQCLNFPSCYTLMQVFWTSLLSL